MTTRERERVADFERASPGDVTNLATESAGSPMQVGAVLFLQAGETFDADALIEVVAARVASTPRLRQRLEPVPLGCGRPVWIDDDHFDISHHLRAVHCPAPRNRAAALEVAADIIASPLDHHRPLWSATLILGLAADEAALVVVFHHVMSDGIGGLAVLANLVDGAPSVTEASDFPRPAPTFGAVFVDAFRERIAAASRLPTVMRSLLNTIPELRANGRPRAIPCSLLEPTGPGRHFELVQIDLDLIHRTARLHDATINDVVLVAVARALRDLVASRGESVDRFVISVPISSRRATTAGELGNEVGVMPIEVLATDDERCLLTTAAATRRVRAAGASSSAALLGPIFRVLARIHLFRWFVDHQRVVHTFVTNLRGPTEVLGLAGHEISDVAAISVITGNVTVAFAVLSYAGTLTITIVTDPVAVPDGAVLRQALDDELHSLTGSTSAPSEDPPAEGP